jgi:hypothetical protein
MKVYSFACKVPVNLERFSRKFNFLVRFLKNTQMSNFMKISLVGAELFHADGRADRRTDKQT